MIELSEKIIELVENARNNIAKATNFSMVCTYFAIGKMIVDQFQHGEARAEYGKKVLKQVSSELTTKFKKGFSVQNLERMRAFYIVYSKSSNELRNSELFEKSSTSLRISDSEINSETKLLPISWSHYLFLLRIEDEMERQFYEIESFTCQWKLEELERQFNSGLFERLTLSKCKSEILSIVQNGQKIETHIDVYKNPLVLEFLGLEEQTKFSESDLETAIINQIEKFMLELGKGFFFGGRQVRFTFDEDHFFVDLVFYNRFLKCFVLVDLKIGKLKHQDIGQMQMYCNYYDRFLKLPDESPTIGIIACKNKNNSMIEISLPEDNKQIFAAQYQTILPNKEDLIKIIQANYESQ